MKSNAEAMKTSAEWMDLLFPGMELVTYAGWPGHRDGVWWDTPITEGDFLARLALSGPTRPKYGSGSYTGWLEQIRGGGCGG